MTVEEILADFPDLEAEDVAEALRYVAEALRYAAAALLERELPLRAVRKRETAAAARRLLRVPEIRQARSYLNP